MKQIYQHDWRGIDTPYIMRWPSKIGEKRPLKINISSWVGMSAGARHVYAEVTEEDNEYWSEENNAWVSVSCSSEASGYHLKADVYTEKEAVRIALTFVEIVAGRHRTEHVIGWYGPGRPRWAKKSLMGE